MLKQHKIVISILSILIIAGLVMLTLYLLGKFDKSKSSTKPSNVIDRCYPTHRLINIGSGNSNCKQAPDDFRNQALCDSKCKASGRFSCVSINMDDCTYKIKTDY